ncbi:hypothetical protein I3760_15G072400 [Carya illinoinensis]|nr:hypothetical protein I3760_15G072400 [Carya illinoinensis]
MATRWGACRIKFLFFLFPLSSITPTPEAPLPSIISTPFFSPHIPTPARFLHFYFFLSHKVLPLIIPRYSGSRSLLKFVFGSSLVAAVFFTNLALSSPLVDLH